MCLRMQKDHIRTLKILWSTSEFSGLWKHQNNPACTNNVRVSRMMKLDTIRKKKNNNKKKKKKKKLFLLPYLFHEILLLTLTLKSGHSPLGMAKIIIF